MAEMLCIRPSHVCRRVHFTPVELERRRFEGRCGHVDMTVGRVTLPFIVWVKWGDNGHLSREPWMEGLSTALDQCLLHALDVRPGMRVWAEPGILTPRPASVVSEGGLSERCGGVPSADYQLRYLRYLLNQAISAQSPSFDFRLRIRQPVVAHRPASHWSMTSTYSDIVR